MEELEHLLIDVLGLPPNRVKVLLFVMKHKRAIAKHICNELDMHQPVVSVVCNDLIEEDIFKAETESRKEGRGRKAYVYSLMASPQATMNKILMPSIKA